MRLLILGGNGFIGSAITTTALDHGADVTLFSRGHTNMDWFSEVRHLLGDRESGDYASLTAEWDAVVDLTGYVPRHLNQAMDALQGRVGRYLFISSQAVYRPTAPAESKEDALRKDPLRDTEMLDQNTYGRLKVACEDDVWQRYGAMATVVRPGRVAGPHDNQDVFTYWARRAARGGRIALPGHPNQPVQVIDVRDLATLVWRLLRGDHGGAYQAVGDTTTIGNLIGDCATAAGSEIELVTVPPVPRFPLILPEEEWNTQRRDPAKARVAGMPSTPLTTTAADVQAWDRSRGEPELTRGFVGAQEKELLSRYL